MLRISSHPEMMRLHYLCLFHKRAPRALHTNTNEDIKACGGVLHVSASVGHFSENMYV